jgi:hypothetical protein
VFEGARECLGRLVALETELSVRSIYEGQPAWRQTLAVLEDVGFTPVQLTRVVRDRDLGALEFDYLGVRAQPRC